nr:arginine--tRNA ligase, cytoplasmic [Tanacetum cinerariifolium]
MKKGKDVTFSDLTKEQLMPSFCKVYKFRFVPCNIFLTYNNDDGKATPCRFTWLGGNKIHTYDPPKETTTLRLGNGGELRLLRLKKEDNDGDGKVAMCYSLWKGVDGKVTGKMRMTCGYYVNIQRQIRCG